MDGIASLFELSLPNTSEAALVRRARRARVTSTQPAQWALDDAITVVLFAGLGGACQGLEEAGCPVQVANNHDAVALAAHAELHKHTDHIRGDIFDVDPLVATRGRPVKLLWASPDCRDHSVAKGAAPRSARVRSLPWQVCRWAGKTRPIVIMLENVREIRGWGPLVAKRDQETGRVLKMDGSVAAKGERVPVRDQQMVRDPARQGRSFKRFTAHIQRLGYAYEDRDLNCADYGVPTSRKRYFGVARRDGKPIGWPKRTHAPRSIAASLGLLPWVPASDIIDWSIPLPSIFERKRPLAEATNRRIATGLRRFILECPAPFIVPMTHTGGLRMNSGSTPLPTLTTAHRGEFAVVGATLAQTGYGEAPGQKPRALDIREPIGTQVAGGAKHALVAAWMAQHNTGVYGAAMADPLSTLTTSGTQQNVAGCYLAKLRGTSTAQAIDQPVPTLSAGGNHVAAVGAFMTKYYSQGGTDQGCADPLHTLSTKGRFSLVTVKLKGRPYVVADIDMRMLEPAEAAAAHELELPREITVHGVRRPLTKTEAMRLIGNSVPKRMARLLAEANVAHALYATADQRVAA
jgi:DNA (cytosine-5)-methyltransferase 1